MFTIRFCSDLHINKTYPHFPTTRQLFDSDESFIADLCILIGDITHYELIKFYKRFLEYLSPFFTLLILIPGNHEYYNNTSQKRTIKELNTAAHQAFKTIPNLEILNNQWIDIGDIRIFGSILWSYVPAHVPDRGLPIYTKKNMLISRTEYNQMNYESIRSLLYCIEESKKDGKSLIVVTHYSPTFDMFDNMKNMKDPSDLMCYWYCNRLDNLINSGNMDMWLFGHTHTPYHERINGTIVMSNPYVYGYSRQMEIRIN